MSSSGKVPPVEIAVRTDPGRDPDKQVNEDSHVHQETPHGLLAVVCDGMGGHAGGREASELAIKTISEIIEAAPTVTPPGVALKRAIEEANAKIWSMPTAEAGFRPGSTVVAMLVHEGGAEIAHVGDSRIYLVHTGAISQVTRDHSIVQQLVDHKVIRPEDAAKHPDANKILRALGIAKDVEVEVRAEPVAYVAGDIFVLCSDGLSDLVEPAEILQIAGTHPPAQATGQLVDLANARGGHDNITAMVLVMKSSASVQHGTVTKTIPFTAISPPPTLVDGGPTGTAVVPPLNPAATTPAPIPAPPPPHAQSHPQVPNIPPPPASTAGKGHPTLIIGIVLALVAVGIVAAFVIVELKPSHITPALVPEKTPDAAVTPSEDGSAPEQAVTAAPTLEPSNRRHADGGVPDYCAIARHAREKAKPQETLDRLDALCKAQHAGQPLPTSPSPHPTPHPTPTPPPPPAPVPVPTPTAPPLAPAPTLPRPPG